ncbi:peptidase C1B bleomycin hydrolase [Dichomitus squalens]|uniref:Cysteine proteinase 1, mitochondrial n=1 Tax=Dichomitus squalens TaxID=114155 RepID=A0A4Q9N040_9APHY|nr:peptidase C1B bleomycin hydrolase [Dichomitus squalens LYAD-421 SS1]EJF65278.1 peptidase C1B bleomycin hydrolase [Dichomitus squalens LYAD-421 SS1]TBU33769.1 peptidase C1B bleomycin hydrolase [Dichomitus squalens]TBU49471.1 peptidase C1B bleomycin hydrolase [Dichomitus squalens]
MGSAPSKATQATPEGQSHDSEKGLLQSFSDVRISAPLSKDGALQLGHVDHWEDVVAQSPKLQLSRSILNHTDIRETLVKREARVADAHVFNLELDFKTNPITSQKSSGRCWLFATTNVLRYNVMKKLNLEEFQLSQSYLFFWDKLNKANYYLELSIENADLPVDDRLVQYLAKELISDGGQWDMAVNLLETYGIVPQPVYPESLHSSLSSPLNTILKTKLREHALILRSLKASLRSNSAISDAALLAALRAKKEELLKEVYVVMSATLGAVPKPDEAFTWDYYDKSGKAGSWTGTPKEFYNAFAYDKYSPAESFSLIHDPRNDYGKLYTVDKLGNLWGARPVLYVNTQIDNLKQAVVRQLKAGHPVFFGCDVGQFSDRQLGIMDQALFTYEAAFDISFGLSKADRLRTQESSMTHAMVISGVHLDKEGNPVRYKVENSWGPDVGDKGYFVMSDRWFEQWVYQVVIPKQLAPKDLVKVFEGEERVVLPAWDPMGSLA